MKFFTWLVIFLIPIAFGCGASSTPGGSQASQKTTIQDTSHKQVELLDGGETFDGKTFKLKLPKGWIVKPDKVVLLHAVSTDSELFPNVKIASIKPPAGATVAAVVNASKESYLKNGTVEEVTETELQGRHVYRLLMTQKLPGNENRQLKYFIQVGDRILIFTGQSRSEAFEENQPLFEAVARTLEVSPLP